MILSRTVCFLLLLALASCGPSASVVNYIVSSKSPYVCCRTIRYTVTTFPDLQKSHIAGDGVAVRLYPLPGPVSCEVGGSVAITVANNGNEDIYIPFSKELEGDQVKLFPWLLFYQGRRPVRLARQVQYSDLAEREDAIERFFRIPSGREVQLTGNIGKRWLCAPPKEVDSAFLVAELNPSFYGERTRTVRATPYHREMPPGDSIALRYDIVYSTLSYLDALPVEERKWNGARDTAQILINLPDEPGIFLDASQRVAESNIVTLRIRE